MTKKGGGGSHICRECVPLSPISKLFSHQSSSFSALSGTRVSIRGRNPALFHPRARTRSIPSSQKAFPVPFHPVDIQCCSLATAPAPHVPLLTSGYDPIIFSLVLSLCSICQIVTIVLHIGEGAIILCLGPAFPSRL